MQRFQSLIRAVAVDLLKLGRQGRDFQPVVSSPWEAEPAQPPLVGRGSVAGPCAAVTVTGGTFVTYAAVLIVQRDGFMQQIFIRRI